MTFLAAFLTLLGLAFVATALILATTTRGEEDRTFRIYTWLVTFTAGGSGGLCLGVAAVLFRA